MPILCVPEQGRLARQSRSPTRGDSKIGGVWAYEAMLLSEADVEAVAAAVEPGSTEALLVWENTWAAPLASAVRRAGGQLVASGRIPVQALLAIVEADETEAGETVGAGHASGGQTVTPSGRNRTRARTATTVATAAVVTHGVPRRGDRREDRRDDRRDRR